MEIDHMLVDTQGNNIYNSNIQNDFRKMSEEDLYTRYKMLQKQLELLEIQEEYIKDETKKAFC